MMLFYIVLSMSTLMIIVLMKMDERKRRKIARKQINSHYERGNLENINGTNVYYLETGEGIPLLIVHGFMASTIEYNEIIQKLSKKFKVIAVDLIGFGRSDKGLRLDYSKRNMAEVVASLLIKKGYKEINVLGHSMGGEVALNIAYQYKKMVKSLILVDSVGYIDIVWPSIPIFVIKHIFKMYYLQRQFYKFCFYNKSFYQEEKFERVYYLNSIIPSKTIKAFSLGNDNSRIGKRIKEIECPTLILWGRRDKVVPLKNSYRFKKDIKNSRLVIFENSGHLPYNEEERKFISVVEDFIVETN